MSILFEGICVAREEVRVLPPRGHPTPRSAQFRTVAVVVARPRQRLHGHVEIGKRLAAVLERPSFILASPALVLALPFTRPGLLLAPVGPALRDKHASQGAQCGSEKWLPVLALLAAAGILPKGWKTAISSIGGAMAIYRILRDLSLI